MKKQTKREKSAIERVTFLQDVVDYYGDDVRRRSIIGNGIPRLITKSGKKSPVGRHLSSSDYFKAIEYHPYTYTGLLNLYPTLIPEKIKMLGEDFLNRVEILHHCREYWGRKKGMTVLGKAMVERLLREHCEFN